MNNPTFGGVSVAGVKPALLNKVMLAARAVGATEIYVTSAKRAPGLAHNDVKNSNHITGDAIDGYAVIGGQRVPIGQALLHVAPQFGLRSGDVKGFDPKTPGGYDPIHVDDGFNVSGRSQPSSDVLIHTPATDSVATPTAPQPVASPTSFLAGLTRAMNMPALTPRPTPKPLQPLTLPTVTQPFTLPASSPLPAPPPVTLPTVAAGESVVPDIQALAGQLRAAIQPTTFR